MVLEMSVDDRSRDEFQQDEALLTLSFALASCEKSLARERDRAKQLLDAIEKEKERNIGKEKEIELLRRNLDIEVTKNAKLHEQVLKSGLDTAALTDRTEELTSHIRRLKKELETNQHKLMESESKYINYKAQCASLQLELLESEECRRQGAASIGPSMAQPSTQPCAF